MRKIKILYVGSTLGYQGPVCQLYNQVKYLDRERFAPVILTLSPEPEDSLMEAFLELQVPCYSLGLSRLSGLFLAAWRIKRFLKAHSVDIICVWGIRAEICLAFIRAEVPMIGVKYEGFLKPLTISHGIFLGTLMNIVEYIAFKRFEGVVCASEAVRRSASKKQQASLRVIRNGVEDAVFHPLSDEEKAKLRDSLGLPKEVMIFLSVGWLTKGKDPVSVVRGFLASKASKKGLLIFVGEGPLRNRCKKLAVSNRKILFFGRVKNVLAFYRSADVFVSGSLTEGLPTASLEAMASGLPVVLSDIPAHRELLQLDPEAGFLFCPEDVMALRDRFDELMDVDLSVHKDAAVGVIREHLSGRKTSQQYQELYLEFHKG